MTILLNLLTQGTCCPVVKAVLRRYTEAPAPVAKKPDEKRVEYKDLIINLSTTKLFTRANLLK